MLAFHFENLRPCKISCCAPHHLYSYKSYCWFQLLNETPYCSKNKVIKNLKSYSGLRSTYFHDEKNFCLLSSIIMREYMTSKILIRWSTRQSRTRKVPKKSKVFCSYDYECNICPNRYICYKPDWLSNPKRFYMRSLKNLFFNFILYIFIYF
jgi:hypothetical protein